MDRHRHIGTLAIVALLAAGAGACGGDDTETTANGGTTSAGGAGGTGGAGGAGNQGGTAGSGGQGGQGGQGGEGGSLPVSDTCPGTAITLGLDDAVHTSGTTEGLTGDYEAWCVGDGSNSGPDAVYELTLTADGTFDVLVNNADASGFDAALYLQTTCGDDDTDVACTDYGQTLEHIRGHYSAGTYYLVVDGDGAMTGAYDLTVTLSTPECGDGVLNPTEICDDANDQPSDGCYECQFETPPSEPNVCPGEAPVQLTTAGLHIQSYTTGFTDDYLGSCTSGTGGLDRVHQIVPQASGTMTVAVGFESDGVTPCCTQDPVGIWCWDYVLYVRTTCDSTGAEQDCSDIDGDVPEVVSIGVTAGQTYWVFVDGYDAEFYSYGPYHLFLTLE